MSTEIDVTDIVEKARSTFVEWAVLYIFGLEVAIPGMEWVALPIVSTIDKEIIRLILTELSKSAVMGAFFLNTAIRKASEAADYVSAVDAKNSLPDDVSDEDYEKAERDEMAAFVLFATVA